MPRDLPTRLATSLFCEGNIYPSLGPFAPATMMYRMYEESTPICTALPTSPETPNPLVQVYLLSSMSLAVSVSGFWGLFFFFEVCFWSISKHSHPPLPLFPFCFPLKQLSQRLGVGGETLPEKLLTTLFGDRVYTLSCPL